MYRLIYKYLMFNNLHFLHRQIISVFSDVLKTIISVFSDISNVNICVVHAHVFCYRWINDRKKILADVKGLSESIGAKI